MTSWHHWIVAKNAIDSSWKPVIHLKMWKKKNPDWIVNCQPQLLWHMLFCCMFGQSIDFSLRAIGEHISEILCWNCPDVQVFGADASTQPGRRSLANQENPRLQMNIIHVLARWTSRVCSVKSDFVITCTPAKARTLLFYPTDPAAELHTVPVMTAKRNSCRLQPRQE